MARCSICHTIVTEGEETTICPQCGGTYHASCWHGIQGCATYGCPAAATAEKLTTPVSLGTGWGDEKTCPDCKKTINASLLTCGCGAVFPWADPMTSAEYHKWLLDKEGRKNTKWYFVVLFAISLPALIAPATGIIAGWAAWAKREELAGEDGAFLALGYGTAALGAAYALVWLCLAAGG